MSTFFRKLGWLRRRPAKEADLDDEIRFHLEEEMDDLKTRGLPVAQAHRDLGNITRLKEDTRATWTWTFWEQLFQDLRYATRTMRANKAFMLLAALSLALGIGANTAIYSVMDAILFRSLPVQDPGSLVRMTWIMRDGLPKTVVHGFHGHGFDEPGARMSSGSFPFPAFELLRKNDALFSSIFAFDPIGSINLVVNGQAEIVTGEYVSGDYFQGLGLPPAAGRLIATDDDREGAPPVAVLSWAFCQKYFGGAANAAGQSILVNNVAFTVAGVTPPEFFGVDPSAAPAIYLPLRLNTLAEGINSFGAKKARYFDKNEYWIQIMARLRPNVSRVQAQTALTPQFHTWVESSATTPAERVELPALLVRNGSGGFDGLRRRFSRPLFVLWTLVGLILAIACANIANLLLARASARRREIALRISVGASRWRVVRQLLTESVLLSSVGGALGLFFAIWGNRFLVVALANGRTDFVLRADLNWHVLLISGAFSVLTGVLFGLAPALQSTKLDVIGALKELRSGSRRSWRGFSAQHVLVVSQIGMSLVILFAAGLFVRNLSNLYSVDLGFNRENVLLFELNARRSGHHDSGIAPFYQDLAKRFSAIPGVRNVTLSNSPLIGDGNWGTDVRVAEKPVNAMFLMVGSGFFSSMQIPLLSGRELDDRDRQGSSPVAVVNERFASLYLPAANPLGRHITFGGPPTTPHDLEIVGLSKNVSYGDVQEAAPATVFIPYTQNLWPLDEMTYEIRTAGDPLVYTPAIRDIVHQADPLLPVAKIRTQAREIDNNLNAAITFARLCSTFAVLALAIACMGLYGAMSYNIARRTSEIGIRMAIGARRHTVVWMVLRDVMLLTVAGLLISIPAALSASQVVKSVLFQMDPNDPLALTASIGILQSAILIAGYLPARKASMIDPMVALGHG